MVAKLELVLSKEEYEQLDYIRKHDAKTYIREKAAGLIKVSEGKSARNVALEGLLTKRQPETVARWIKKFKKDGIKSLRCQPGRGRKPAFPP
jgi:transposase